MAHLLYRPHVVGPEDDITTPDVVLDRLAVWESDERHLVPVHRVTQAAEVQALEEVRVTPAYALLGCGGGPLLSIAAIVRTTGQALTTADVLLSRSAWRLRNVLPQFETLKLQLQIGNDNEATTIGAGPKLTTLSDQPGGSEPAIPRGILEVCATPSMTIETSAPCVIQLALSDSTRNRTIGHITTLESIASDRWESRPLPRYTVGPVGDVKHYI